MKEKVLITGGSGLIGQYLSKILLQYGFEVAILGRKKISIPSVKSYTWDIPNQIIEEGALQGTAHLIHLAGAGIADKRWTADRKKVILESRTKPVELLAQQIQQKGIQLKSFVSASGISYYGDDTGEQKHTESDHPGNSFLAEVTQQWENVAESIQKLGIRTVLLRTGIVLSKHGGALEKMTLPARFGLGSPLGSGKQWMSWIHIHDLCQMYSTAMTDKTWNGTYNAVAPQPVRNEEFMKVVCKALGRPLWLPNAPTFALKMMLGEMSEVVLGSNNVVNERIEKETDFHYAFPLLDLALVNLIGS